MEVLTINKICDLINNIFPKNITFKDYNSGMLDLTNEVDKFFNKLKDLLGVDEDSRETILMARAKIKESLNTIKSKDKIDNRELINELLITLDQKLDDLATSL
jgi:dsDNA-binding SOS-regulon protein